MTDELNPPDRLAAQPSGASPADDSDEPFACPHCGQMLAPTCRVCVACRQPIDPAQIRREPPVEPPQVPATNPAQVQRPVEAQAAPSPELAPVRFSWRMFFLVLGLAWLTAAAALVLLGAERARMVMAWTPVVLAVWVYLDARQKRLPKPLRWSVGTVFPVVWIFVFPWYLVRRQRPQAPCPFVEREASPMVRLLLAVLALLFLLLMVAALMSGPGKKDLTPNWHIFPSSGGRTVQSLHFHGGQKV